MLNDMNSISIARGILAEVYCLKADTPVDYIDYLICEMEWYYDGNEKIYDNQGVFRGELFREWIVAKISDNNKYLEDAENYIRGELGMAERS